MTTVMTVALPYNARNAKKAERLRKRGEAITDAERDWLATWEEEHPRGAKRVRAAKASPYKQWVSGSPMPAQGTGEPPPLVQTERGDESPSETLGAQGGASGSPEPAPEASPPVAPAPVQGAAVDDSPRPSGIGTSPSSPPPLVVPGAPPPAPSSADLDRQARKRDTSIKQIVGFAAGRLMAWEHELAAAGRQGFGEEAIMKMFAPSLYNLLDEFLPADVGWYGDAATVAMIGSAQYRMVSAVRGGKVTARKPRPPESPANGAPAATRPEPEEPIKAPPSAAWA